MAGSGLANLSPMDALHLAECAHIAALNAVVREGFTKAAEKDTKSFVGRAFDVLKLHDEMVG